MVSGTSTRCSESPDFWGTAGPNSGGVWENGYSGSPSMNFLRRSGSVSPIRSRTMSAASRFFLLIRFFGGAGTAGAEIGGAEGHPGLINTPRRGIVLTSDGTSIPIRRLPLGTLLRGSDELWAPTNQPNATCVNIKTSAPTATHMKENDNDEKEGSGAQQMAR